MWGEHSHPLPGVVPETGGARDTRVPWGSVTEQGQKGLKRKGRARNQGLSPGSYQQFPPARGDLGSDLLLTALAIVTARSSQSPGHALCV